MKLQELPIQSIITTFFIGAVAGISPFLFAQVLPSILDPTNDLVVRNFYALVVTGVMVGVVTSIIFTRAFKGKEPAEIFFYALGIPALLVSTASTAGLEISKEREIAGIAVNVSTVMEGMDVVLTEPTNSMPRTLERPQASMRWSLPFVSTAYAYSEPETAIVPMQASSATYAVVLGEYSTTTEAWQEYDRVAKRKFRTETYITKSLSILEFSKTRYVLIYSKHVREKDALRATKLLRVLDSMSNAVTIKYGR